MNRAAAYFSLFGLGSWGLSVMSKANLPSYALTLPSLTPHRCVGTTSFLPLLYLQTLPLCWFHPFRLEICLTSSILEKNPPSLPPFPILSFFRFMEKLLECSLFPSSLSSPPICYCTHDKRLSCYSSLQRVSCYEDFPHFSLYFFHLSF